MSLSKVYKDGSFAALQTLQFLDFDQGGGLVGGPEESPSGFAETSLATEEFNPGGAAVAGMPAAQAVPLAPAEPPAPPLDMEKVREEAYARGRQDGLEEAEGRLGPPVKAFTGALAELTRLRESILKNSTDDMLRLVMALAEQVISCEVATNPDIVYHTLNKALQAAVRSDEYHVKVNPEDFALINEKKPLLLASISGLRNITFDADPGISRGGCLVESELGEVDATIETQLEEIRQKTLLAAVSE